MFLASRVMDVFCCCISRSQPFFCEIFAAEFDVYHKMEPSAGETSREEMEEILAEIRQVQEKCEWFLHKEKERNPDKEYYPSTFKEQYTSIS